MTDYRRLMNLQKKLLPIVLFYAIMVFFSTERRESYMGISYNLIPFAVMYLISGIEETSFFLMIGGASIFLVTFIYGSRGAVVCGAVAFFIYFVFKLLRNARKPRLMDFIWLTVLFTGLFLIILSWDNIISALMNRFVTSRTLIMILRGRFNDDSGRQRLYSYIGNAINESPFLPHGLYSDRILIAKLRGIEASYGTYPHNYIYEVIYQFGVIIGIGLLIGNAMLIFRWLKTMKTADKDLFIASISFIPVTFIQLMLSSSYLISFTWGISMGIMLGPNMLRRGQSVARAHYPEISDNKPS